MIKMGCLLISSDQVGNLIDVVLEDVANGMGIRLYDLAGVLDSIAEAQEDPVLHVFPQAVGGFASALLNSRKLVALPMLPDPMRQRLNSIIKTAVQQSVKSLKTIKDELCSKDDPNHKELMHAIGVLFRQTGILIKESRAISSRRQSNPPTGME
jgi:hypothetical protein